MKVKRFKSMQKNVSSILIFMFVMFNLMNVANNVTPAQAATAANHVVISQIYGGGGNSGATYTNDFVELYNPTSSDVDLTGWSLQYQSATGTNAFSNSANLNGTIKSHGYYLYKGASGGSVGTSLPTVSDATTTSAINLSATTGKIALANTTAFISGKGDQAVIDFVGYGTANAYEGVGAAPAPSNSTSIQRKDNNGTDPTSIGDGNGNGYDTDNNSTDFVTSNPVRVPKNTLSSIEGGAPATVNVTGVALDQTALTVGVGSTATLTPTVTPATATNKAVTWASSDTSVATVVNGVVTGVAAGTANITATSVDGNFVSPLCVVTVTANAPPANKTFDIVEITDFHGQLLDSTNTKPVGAALAYAVKAVKAANPNDTLIIGGGDLYQGTPVSNVLQGVPVQKVMSNLGMEVTALGNHEFDWNGLDTINNITMAGASYSIVCANMYNKGTNTRPYDPYKIITKDGVRIAVIGAITQDAPNIIMPAFVAPYDFRDPATEINNCAKEIRDNNKADIILADVHEGAGALDTIVSKLHGVDVVFGGHSHTILDNVEKDADNKDVPTLNAQNAGKGFIDLKITVNPTTNAIVSFSPKGGNWHPLTVTTSSLVDPTCNQIVNDAWTSLAPTFNRVIGNDPTAYTSTQDDNPYGESQLGNWMADVVKNYAKADVGIVNNGGIRLSPIPAGDVTVGTIFNIMPFDNEITTVHMTGLQLKKIFEQAVQDSGKGIQISGVKFTYDSTKPTMQRVTGIYKESDNSVVNDTDNLVVAAPDFVATGGDGFTGFLDSNIPSTYFDSHKLVRDALMDDVTAKGKITFVMDNRVDNQVAEVPPVEMTIAQARAASIGTTVTLTGYVSAVNGNNVFMQDNATSPTAGICVYNSGGTIFTVHKGDKITATGPLSTYNGLLEITPSAASKVTILGSGNVVTPKEVTVSSATNAIQGQLVKIKNLIIDSIDNSGPTMAHDSTGSINIYKMPVVSGLAAGDTADVTAAVTCYGTTIELAVDSAADVVKTSGTVPPPAAAKISIIGTSDLHGAIYPIDYNTGLAANVGLAKVSTYVNSVRAANPYTMLIDNGDTIQGTPLSYYYDMIDKTSEYPMMKVMGAMKYDTWTLGNHEFNYGLDTLNRVIGDATKEGITTLSANTYKADNTNFVKPYIIKAFTVNGKTIRVGILGLTTKCIPNWEDPAHYAGLHFNDLVDEAKKWVPIVRATQPDGTAGADVVIVAAHTGTSTPSDTIPENQADLIAKNVSGIDAILCGHAHTGKTYSYTNPDGKVIPVVEPKNGDGIFSQIDLNIDANGNYTGLSAYNVTLPSNAVADPAILTLAQPYEDATLSYTNTVIGQSTAVFDGPKQLTAPSTIMELVNKVQAANAGTTLSIAAPLSLTAKVPQGDVKRQDIMGVYVYENYLYGLNMTGKQLKNWLEWSVRYYKQTTSATDPITAVTDSNGKQTIPDYNLDQLYGATYDIDLTQPACTTDATGLVTSGNRIKNLKINGVLVKDTDVFKVAVNNYRYNGGGGFMAAAGFVPGSQATTDATFYSSQVKLGDDGQVRNMMFKYVQDNSPISPTNTNNWHIYTTSNVYAAITNNSMVRKGDDVTVTIGTDALHAVNDLYGFDMTFKYDPSLFTFESASLNNNFATDSTGSLSYDTTDGAVRLLGTLVGANAGVSGANIGLVNVTLKANSTTAATSGFSVVANSNAIFPNSTTTMFANKLGYLYTLAGDVSSPITIGNDDAALSGITVNGKQIAGFISSNALYNMVLPMNTTGNPVIEYSLSDSKATAVLQNITGYPGTATIIVTAQDGVTKKTYTINFTKADALKISLKSPIVEVNHDVSSLTLKALSANDLKRFKLVFKYDTNLFNFVNISKPVNSQFTLDPVVNDGNGNITITGACGNGQSGDLDLVNVKLTAKTMDAITSLTLTTDSQLIDSKGVMTSIGADLVNNLAIANSAVNGIGSTTVGDLTTVASVIGKLDKYNAKYDMNKDGSIDIIDIGYIEKVILFGAN